MPANTSPIWTRTPDIQFGGAVLGPSANTAQDGTGSNIYSIWQADTNNAGFLRKVVFRSVGSPAATVARLYVCSVTGTFTAGTSNTAATTSLIGELTLNTTTLSQTAAAPPYELFINEGFNIGYRLLVSFGTSTGAAGTGYAVTAFGGKF